MARSRAHEGYVCKKPDDKVEKTGIPKKREAAAFYRTIDLRGLRCKHSAAVWVRGRKILARLAEENFRERKLAHADGQLALSLAD